jgi:aminoacylase
MAKFDNFLHLTNQIEPDNLNCLFCPYSLIGSFEMFRFFVCIILLYTFAFAQQSVNPTDIKLRDSRIERLITYLNINTCHPKPDYPTAISFLKSEYTRIGLPFHIEEPTTGFPIFIAKWEGRNSSLPSIMLNSHMDIVKADKEKWTTKDPFVAETRDGKIFCRGIQDMKSVGMQHMEAVETLISEGFKPDRTVYITYVPDEEIGGGNGMQVFVNSRYFKQMNVGLELDEGLATESDVYGVFTAERIAHWTIFTITGEVGHGSTLPSDSAGEKFVKLISKVYKKRDELVKEKEKSTLGAVMSINLTAMKAGDFTAVNVIPGQIEFSLDIRVPPTKFDEFHQLLKEWSSMADGISYRFHNLHGDSVVPFHTEESEWWTKFRVAMKKSDIKYEKLTFAAATDARFIRLLGIPAIGFSPMIKTPVLLHGHDEHLSKEVYLNGIDVFVSLLKNLLK